MEGQAGHSAGDSGQQVDEGHRRMARKAFQQLSDNPKAPHIPEKVQKTDVEKEMGHQPPPLAGKRARPIIGAPRNERVDVSSPQGQRTITEGLCQADDNASRDQTCGDKRPRALHVGAGWALASRWGGLLRLAQRLAQLVDLVQVVNAGGQSDMTSGRREGGPHLLAGRVRLDPTGVEEREVNHLFLPVEVGHVGCRTDKTQPPEAEGKLAVANCHPRRLPEGGEHRETVPCDVDQKQDRKQSCSSVVHHVDEQSKHDEVGDHRGQRK